MPSASPFSAFRTPSVLGLVCVLALSACSTGEEDGSGPAPSVISPAAPVACEDRGDCGEPGSVRWSIPLPDDYQMTRSREEASRITPASQWLDHEAPNPGAVVDDNGILYHHRDALVTAIDSGSGTELWTQELDHPVERVRMAGQTMVVRTLTPGERGDGRIHLFLPDGDGARPLETDLPEDVLLGRRIAANDTHLVVWDEILWGFDDDVARIFLIDAATGAVEWEHTGRVGLRNHNLSDDNTLYLEQPEPESVDEPLSIVGAVDGEEVIEFDLPEEVGRSSYQLWATDTGELLFNSDHCTLGQAGCADRRITAVDADTGRTMWSEERAGAIVSMTEDGSTTRLHIETGNDYRTLDARTGEVLAEGVEAAGETEALLGSFGVSHPHPRTVLPSELRSLDEESLAELEPEEAEELADRRAQELDMIPAGLYGPGMEEVTLDGLAAGIRRLTTYLSEDGKVVGVFLGCAPGGVRPSSWDSASSEAVCAEPRLFAVDYGV